MATRTSKADRNLFSISNGICQLYAGTDNPQPALLDYLSGPSPLLPERPHDWDAILKVCDHTKDLDLVDLIVAQGNENAVDLNNRVENTRLEGEWGFIGGEGDQVITVKGGCRGILIAGTVRSKGKNAHVVVGAWSDQCHDISQDLDFSLLRSGDGSPLTFILCRCKDVKLPSGAKVLRLKSAAYWAYWWLKLAAVKLGLFR